MQFGFWLLRYICTFMLFILGMKAPGLPHKPYMLLVNEEERDVENSQVSPRAGAAWEHGRGGDGDRMETQLLWKQHLQETRDEPGLGLPKLPAWQEDTALLRGWSEAPGRKRLVFWVGVIPGAIASWAGVPGQ